MTKKASPKAGAARPGAVGGTASDAGQRPGKGTGATTWASASKAETLRRWRALELPVTIAAWLELMPEVGRSRRYIERAARFIEHCSTDSATDQLRKDWVAVSAASQPGREAPELSVFMGLPDDIEFNPFALVYGGRRLDPDIIKIERARYARQREHVRAIIDALSNDNVRKLLQDAGATPAARTLAGEFRARHWTATREGLKSLANLLDMIDPAAKVPTAQPFALDAAQAIFANLVAQLNRHLDSPKHAALARLSRVNCPAATVTAEQVRKAWSRADKLG